MRDYADFENLVGMTLTSINVSRADDKIEFVTSNGVEFEMYHEQDCCEGVSIDDIVGDLDDLTGTPITLAEEVSDSGDTDYGTCTWTYYRLATSKGLVSLKWYGESNGYYSESVGFFRAQARGALFVTTA